MDRAGAVVTFLAAYMLGQFAIAHFHAGQFARETALRPSAVAMFFAAVVLPAALVAAGIVVIISADFRARLLLAVSFAAATTLAVESLFIAAEIPSLARVTDRVHLGWFVGIDGLLICGFVVAGFVVHRRASEKVVTRSAV